MKIFMLCTYRILLESSYEGGRDGREGGMYKVWERRTMRMGIWWAKLKETDRLEGIGIFGRIINSGSQRNKMGLCGFKSSEWSGTGANGGLL